MDIALFHQPTKCIHKIFSNNDPVAVAVALERAAAWLVPIGVVISASSCLFGAGATIGVTESTGTTLA
jgi:hypothetical protein